MIPRIALFALIPVLGMAGGYLGATSIMPAASASQADGNVALHTPKDPMITFTEDAAKEQAEAEKLAAAAAPVKSLDEALDEMRVFANPEKAEDERIAGVLKLGRFSAQVGQGRDTVVLVADIAIDFSNRAVAAELWNKTALVEFRDTVLTALLKSAELPDVRKTGFDEDLLKKEMLLQLRADIPGLTGIHLIKLSTRLSSIEADGNSIELALR